MFLYDFEELHMGTNETEHPLNIKFKKVFFLGLRHTDKLIFLQQKGPLFSS